jgi:sorting nexin-3/12
MARHLTFRLSAKAYVKQLPFLNNDDGIFEDDFIEDRRRGLEEFINILAGHPLVQGEKCIHMFLQDDRIDRDGYVPGKIGH